MRFGAGALPPLLPPGAAPIPGEADFDVVLCDYRLTGETAGGVVEALAVRAPGLVPRVVIATGATTDPGVGVRARRHHLPLVAKPYGQRELAELAARASEGRPAA